MSHIDSIKDFIGSSFHLILILVRRNETICCLIGFGIGVGCCILYRLLSNFLSSSSSTTSISTNTLSSLSNKKRDVSIPIASLIKLKHVSYCRCKKVIEYILFIQAKTSHMGQEHSAYSSNGNEITVTYTKRPRSSTTVKRTVIPKCETDSTNKSQFQSYSIDSDREPLLGLPINKHHQYIPSKSLTDDTTWSEMSSSIGTIALLQDSYHSNSLTGDSGVDCQEISTIKSSRHQTQLHNTTTTTIPIIDDDDDDDESFLHDANHPVNSTLYSGNRRYDSDTALSRGVILHDTRK